MGAPCRSVHNDGSVYVCLKCQQIWMFVRTWNHTKWGTVSLLQDSPKTKQYTHRKLPLSSFIFQNQICNNIILANCPYLIGTVPILTREKGRKKEWFYQVSLFLQNLPVVMYRKFRNVPIFKYSSHLSLFHRFQGWQVCNIHMTTLYIIPIKLCAAKLWCQVHF